MKIVEAIRRFNAEPLSWGVLAIVVVPTAWFLVIVAMSISI